MANLALARRALFVPACSLIVHTKFTAAGRGGAVSQSALRQPPVSVTSLRCAFSVLLRLVAMVRHVGQW